MNAKDARRSISATLTEIEAGHKALGIPPEPDDIAEAMAIIARIEARWPALRRRKPQAPA